MCKVTWNTTEYNIECQIVSDLGQANKIFQNMSKNWHSLKLIGYQY